MIKEYRTCHKGWDESDLSSAVPPNLLPVNQLTAVSWDPRAYSLVPKANDRIQSRPFPWLGKFTVEKLDVRTVNPILYQKASTWNSDQKDDFLLEAAVPSIRLPRPLVITMSLLLDSPFLGNHDLNYWDCCHLQQFDCLFFLPLVLFRLHVSFPLGDQGTLF